MATAFVIPEHELEFSYARSSGPGGQNVNKVNSKVILRWNVVQSTALRPEVIARFVSRYGSRLTQAGDILITSDRFRDQTRNREDCLTKLSALISVVEHPPRPRKKTKPSYASKQRGKQSKRLHGEKKRQRRRIESD